ncbi:MAG: alpha/beta hydrolase [Deltaproteobacteria bacterium]|nr:alpha/beta hydrolase [Deltaproteobacteria bacterium]
MKLKHKKVKSFDGTSIGYQTYGRGKKTIVLCNGLGGSVVAWKPLYQALGDRYRFISWDYRGLFKSKLPKNPEAMTIQDQARDLEAILKKEKVTKALIAGWSMGVQVALEFYRLAPEKFSALFLLNGTYGNPFHTALNSPLSRYILPQINELAHRLAPALQPRLVLVASRLIDWKGFVDIIARLGLVHKNLDRAIFKEVAREMISTDLQVYHVLMRYLSRHSAAGVLKKIRVPTLIITGDEDIMTPKKVAEKMAHEIPKAELFIVAQGTHYCLLEFPDTILLRFKKFLGEHYSI